MKAISLTQPWAMLIAIGAKKIETRSWTTTHRGPVAIHASKNFPGGAMELCCQEPCRSVLASVGIRGPRDLPCGAILAIAELKCVRSSEVLANFLWTRDKLLSFKPVECIATIDGIAPAEHEYAFGDYSPDRLGFVFSHVERLAEPIPCRGRLGLWDVPEEIAARLELARAR